MAVSGMADLTANNNVVDCRLNTGVRIATQQTEENNYSNINDLDTRLSAIDATTYTVTYLRMLTKNDKLYALRLATADVAGVK